MTYFKGFRAFFTLAALLIAAGSRAEEPPLIQSFALKNGMQVLLMESHRVPAVTHMLWYRVGAADDFPGRSGLAHYNEHMMFQGTAKVPAGVFLHTISSHGGHANAFTSRDYTAYYVSIAREHLPLLMEMEADRMLNLAPTKENFAKEREVIIEERRMSVENEPQALLGEEMQAALYRNHPYHNSIIGWMAEMQALSREDVLNFHQQFYHPANAVLVVAGDITKAELQTLAEKYYGGLPGGDAYQRHWRIEPPERAPRHIEMHHINVQEPLLYRTYIAPGAGQDSLGLVVPSYLLSQILGGGETSRLYQSLVVKQKIATNVSTDFDGLSVGPGEFHIDVIPATGTSLPQLEAALDKALEAALHTPPNTAELSRAKTLLKADTLYARDGNEGAARTLGALVMAGLPPDYFTAWPKKVDDVSSEDLQKAAAYIFNPNASVTGYLLPEKEAK